MSAMLRSTARLARLSQRSAASRCFSTSQGSRKDIVQDMYISELKAYKPPPPAKDAHVGVVKAFSAPSAPKPPSNPTDLASELSAYDAAEPILAGSATAKAKTSVEESGAGAQEFLELLEADLPKPDHHHH